MEKLYLFGPLSSTDPEHLKAFERHADRKATPPAVEVETITLDLLLEKAGLEKIDFLSMDIEEGEPAALRAFDIERFRPELVCIEAGPPKVREAIAPYFEAHGYERIDAYLAHDVANWYFRPRPE